MATCRPRTLRRHSAQITLFHCDLLAALSLHPLWRTALSIWRPLLQLNFATTPWIVNRIAGGERRNRTSDGRSEAHRPCRSCCLVPTSRRVMRGLQADRRQAELPELRMQPSGSDPTWRRRPRSGQSADRERRAGGGDRTDSGAVGPHARSHAYEERKRVDGEREQQPAKESDAGVQRRMPRKLMERFLRPRSPTIPTTKSSTARVYQAVREKSSRSRARTGSIQSRSNHVLPPGWGGTLSSSGSAVLERSSEATRKT